MDTKVKLTNTISNSSISSKDKDELLVIIDKEDYRFDLNIKLTEMIFEKRVVSKKPNFDLHSKLNYIYDEDTFNKNCIDIVKKL